MRRLFLFCLLLIFCLQSLGQHYVLEYDINHRHTSGRDVRFYHTLEYVTSNGSVGTFNVIWADVGKRTGSIKVDCSQGFVHRIHTVDGSIQMYALGWNPPDRGDKTFEIDYSNYVTEFNVSFTNNYWAEYYWTMLFFPFWVSSRYAVDCRFKFYPNFKSTTSSDTDSLYYYDKVNISFTKGFPLSAYKGKGRWQWRIGDGGWNDIPSHLINDNEPHCISVCGKDLIKETEIREYAGKYIHFRINNPVKTCCETVSLLILPPPVLIKSINPIQPKCYGDKGELHLDLQEPLEINDDVVGLINDVSYGDNQRVRVLDDRRSIVIVVEDFSKGVENVVSLKRSIRNSNGRFTSEPCIIRVSDFLNNPAAVTFTASHLDVPCYGEAKGKITVFPTGGTGIYRIMLDGVKKANDVTGDYTITGLVARDSFYIVEVQDTSGCSHDAAKSIKITQPEAPLSIKSVKIKEHRDGFHTSGYHSHDGQIEVHVSGGTKPYTVYCSDDFNKKDSLVLENSGVLFFENLHRGNYSIKVRDANGCTAVQDTILKSPEELRVWIKQLARINCYGYTSGILTDSVVGGVGSYHYEWFKIDDKNDTISQPHYLAAGRYRVVVTDDNGIKASAEYELTQPDSITIDFPVVALPTCGNQHQGRIEAAVQGGTQPYTYRWGHCDSSTNYAIIAKGGLYSLTIEDANGCPSEGSIAVQSPGELTVSHTATAPTCHGLSDGRIELTVSGGSEPYTVRWADELWETPATIPALAQRGPNALCDEDSEIPDFGGQLTRTNLPAGRYEAVVTDSTGCEVVVSVVLEQPEPIALWLGHDLTLCSGARTLLCAQSNRDGLRYSWHTPWTFAPQTEPQLWADAAGSYVVTATDSVGCMASDTVQVLQSSDMLPLDITAPSSAAARATVHAVNLSPDGVEQVRWILPTEAEVVRTNDVEAVFIMPRSGTYQIAFEARTDRCSATIGQPLEILDTLVLPGSDDVPLIQQFLLSPNGQYLSVRVELREASRMVLNLLTADGRLIDQHVQPSAKTHTHRFALKGLPAGDYQVVLQVDGQVATLRYAKKD